MALTEQTLDDKIELVGEFRQVHIRTATIIKRDGEEISRSFHRRVLAPDSDVTEENEEIKGITDAAWTQDVKDAYAAELASQIEPPPEPKEEEPTEEE
jgi:hypothetical protein|tara:strand:+ start:108 stop:401 length:294 start_codon:yes stop_codon:yes gene_type:complete